MKNPVKTRCPPLRLKVFQKITQLTYDVEAAENVTTVDWPPQAQLRWASGAVGCIDVGDKTNILDLGVGARGVVSVHPLSHCSKQRFSIHAAQSLKPLPIIVYSSSSIKREDRHKHGFRDERVKVTLRSEKEQCIHSDI